MNSLRTFTCYIVYHTLAYSVIYLHIHACHIFVCTIYTYMHICMRAVLAQERDGDTKNREKGI